MVAATPLAYVDVGSGAQNFGGSLPSDSTV
jgi:hypothetical protein